MGEYEFKITTKGTNKGQTYLNKQAQKIIAGVDEIDENTEKIEGKMMTDACLVLLFPKDADNDDIIGGLKILTEHVKQKKRLSEKRKENNVRDKNEKEK